MLRAVSIYGVLAVVIRGGHSLEQCFGAALDDDTTGSANVTCLLQMRAGARARTELEQGRRDGAPKLRSCSGVGGCNPGVPWPRAPDCTANVRFEFQPSFWMTDAKKGLAKEAMLNWMTYTCIRFEPVVDADPYTTASVQRPGRLQYQTGGLTYWRKEGRSCVTRGGGYPGDGNVRELDFFMSFMIECLKHELGHVLTLEHTFTRPDTFNDWEYDNGGVKPVKVAKALKLNIPTLLETDAQWKPNDKTYVGSPEVGFVPFPYGSVMMYEASGYLWQSGFRSFTAFSLPEDVVDRSWMKVIGKEQVLDPSDASAVNDIHSCHPGAASFVLGEALKEFRLGGGEEGSALEQYNKWTEFVRLNGDRHRAFNFEAQKFAGKVTLATHILDYYEVLSDGEIREALSTKADHLRTVRDQVEQEAIAAGAKSATLDIIKKPYATKIQSVEDAVQRVRKLREEVESKDGGLAKAREKARVAKVAAELELKKFQAKWDEYKKAFNPARPAWLRTKEDWLAIEEEITPVIPVLRDAESVWQSVYDVVQAGSQLNSAAVREKDFAIIERVKSQVPVVQNAAKEAAWKGIEAAAWKLVAPSEPPKDTDVKAEKEAKPLTPEEISELCKAFNNDAGACQEARICSYLKVDELDGGSCLPKVEMS